MHIVSESTATREEIADVLRSQPLDVVCFASEEEFFDSIDARTCGCVVVPADLREAGARRLIEGIRQRKLCLAVVVIGRDDDLRAAVDLIRGGATEFVEHPMRAGALKTSVRRALAAARVAHVHCK